MSALKFLIRSASCPSVSHDSQKDQSSQWQLENTSSIPLVSSTFGRNSASSSWYFCFSFSKFSTLIYISRNLVAPSSNFRFDRASASYNFLASWYSTSFEAMLAFMSEIRALSLSACPFSRAKDSRRSFSVFSSATPSFRRAFIESRAFVYLLCLRRYSSETGAFCAHRVASNISSNFFFRIEASASGQ
jgi:hypothetical protein